MCVFKWSITVLKPIIKHILSSGLDSTLCGLQNYHYYRIKATADSERDDHVIHFFEPDYSEAKKSLSHPFQLSYG